MPYSVIIKEAPSCSRWEQRPIARQHAERESFKHKALHVHQMPSFWAWGIPLKRRQQDGKNQKGWRTLGEQSPPNQLNRSHKNFQRLKQQAQCLSGSVPGPLYMYYNFQLSNSNGTPWACEEVSLWFLCLLMRLSSFCLVALSVLVMILFYFTIFYFVKK